MRGQRDLLVLERAVGLAARAPHRPPRAVAPRVAALEVDLGPALRRAAPQQRAHVLRAERARIVVAAADDDAAVVRQPRRAIEQRHAQRVEQRALARAGVADDREHARAAERRRATRSISNSPARLARLQPRIARILMTPSVLATSPRDLGEQPLERREHRARSAARRDRAPTAARTPRADRARRAAARADAIAERGAVARVLDVQRTRGAARLPSSAASTSARSFGSGRSSATTTSRYGRAGSSTRRRRRQRVELREHLGERRRAAPRHAHDLDRARHRRARGSRRPAAAAKSIATTWCL